MKFATLWWRSGPKPLARALSPSPSPEVIPRVPLSALPRYTRVTPRTCHLPASSLSSWLPKPTLCRPGSLGSGALGEGRRARVGTAGGRHGVDSEAAPVMFRSLQRGQHLFPPPAQLITSKHARNPFWTSLQPARAGNAESRGFQTPGSNLSAPAPEWLPGWRSCRKLPRPLSTAAPNQPRQWGGRRKAEMDRGRMLSSLAIRLGNVSTPPAYSGGHPSASPAPGRTERLSLSPFAAFGLFHSPFLFQKESH